MRVLLAPIAMMSLQRLSCTWCHPLATSSPLTHYNVPTLKALHEPLHCLQRITKRHSVQNDILVPQVATGGDRTRSTDYLYAVAGNELVVLAPSRASAGAKQAVVSRIELLPPSRDRSYSVKLTPTAESADSSGDAKDSVSIECGIASTFRARSAVLAPRGDVNAPPKLVVIGSARECLSTGEATNSPQVLLESSPAPTSGRTYYSTTTRPFPTVLAIVFDVSDPAAPVAEAMVQVEGHLERVHLSGEYAWLFAHAAPHQPYSPDADNSDATRVEGLTDSNTMPMFRTRRRRSQSTDAPWADWTSFASAGGCTDVRQVYSGGSSGLQAQGTGGGWGVLMAVPLHLSVASDVQKTLVDPNAVSHYVAPWDPAQARAACSNALLDDVFADSTSV